MEGKDKGAQDNPGYITDKEIPVTDISTIKDKPDSNDQVVIQVDNIKDPYEQAKLRKGGHSFSPNGHVSEEDDDHDLVLEKKVFDPQNYSASSRAVMRIQGWLIDQYKSNEVVIWKSIKILLLLAFCAYFGYAMYYSFGDEASIRLLVCTVLGLLLLLKSLTKAYVEPISRRASNYLSNSTYEKHRRIIRWVLYIVSTITTVTLLIVVVALDTPENLLSLAGLGAFIVLCFLTSYNPAMIDWHPVFWGFSVQFYFAIIILKTRWGYDMFNWLGSRVVEFLEHGKEGAKFVFGDSAKIVPLQGPPIEFEGVYTLHFFAFALMPVITFFSTTIAVLYYLGIMQTVIKVIGRSLSFCLGTTPAESLNAAGNIFVSMTEAPLMIRPFVVKMTRSELHAVMTGGFATIAGGLLGVYTGFGVPAEHLLSASVMSAPAALAISKLTYPEIEVPVNTENIDFEKGTERNLIEAACNGAITSIKIIAAVIVNVMAFLSLLKFVNATLTWFGDRVGIENFTFELICSYVLYPVALFMGTEPADCRKIAELVGIKTFTNEFIAYQKFSILLSNKVQYNKYVAQYGEGLTHMDGEDLVLEMLNGTKLIKGFMSRRSEIIATYALCGFSNFGSMGILLGGMSAIAPKRRSALAKLIMRAMIAGNVACFFTACIAGLFFQEFD